MDALQWMGAVRMRADKNITVIHTTPVHQLMSLEDINNIGLTTSNQCFRQNASCLYILSLSPVDFSPELGDKSAQIKYCFQAKTLNKHVGVF